jgi:uncharacterized MAPEG superfamily protein
MDPDRALTCPDGDSPCETRPFATREAAIGRGDLMTFELRMLALSVVLGLVHIVLNAHTATQQHGLDWNVGARDQIMPPLSGVAGRLHRAMNNFLETFPLFAAAILLATVAGKGGPLTVWGSLLYFSGRLVYLPLYAFGIQYVRTAAWSIAVGGIILILVALL